MRKACFILFTCLVCCSVFAQQYYNEWIDYTKTYYKFKVGATKLYRINQTNLPAALQVVPAERFQLWRNGKEVALYTSVVSGVIPANGYIEFWGEKNDGLPDRNLYKDPTNQLSTDLSLETDTAAYFLTINTANNLRITDAANNVSGTTLLPEQSFLYHYRYDFDTMINRGRAVNYGTNVYSSTYDIGEWWSSREISPSSPLTISAGNLYAANTGTPQLNVSVAGNSAVLGDKTVKVNINGSNVINYPSLDGMSAAILNSNNFNSSLLNAANTTFTISMINTNNGGSNDRIVAGFIDLSYAREFNFGGAKNFPFSLPATTQGNYLKITGFASSNAVLYDLTNNKRYAANTSVPDILQFVLPASALERNLVLVSEEATPINSFTVRSFPNYSVSANQGDYLIISNKILISSGNAVQSYATYRSGSTGGSYNAKIYDIDDLVDEFAYGIKKHPLAVKNFLSYARNTFSVVPKFAFLIGKAVTYNDARMHETSSYYDRLNLVPTFGWPASDNLLASNDLTPVPATPIGRLSAVTQNEVQTYLNKIKEYETAQQDTSQVAETVANKAWMKNIVHVIGADDVGLNGVLNTDMNSYKNIATDTLFGANVYTFNKTTSTSGATVLDALMTQLFSNGISLLNYFGHSSASILDYNLNKPQDYNNQKKYPVFIVNGCDAGDIFSFDTARFSTFNSLSEAWVFAQNRGSIAYIASTHFGIETYLDIYNTGFYNSFVRTKYNVPLSYNLKDAVSYLLNTSSDFAATLHAEESVLHGDPALKINSSSKPDFDIEAQNVTINPTFVSVADNNFKVKCYFYNLGKATGDSVSVLIQRKYPDGSTATLFSQRIPSVRYIDSVEITVPIIATRDKGQNSLTVTIDNEKQYDELSELNNTVTKDFFIYEDELTPVYPYNFSIVNKSNIKLYASTANPVIPMRSYVMEMDTTELFNSLIKTTQTIASVGGVIEFNSTIPFTDSTVYYWRVAPVPSSGAYHWNTSSFVYLPNVGFGYNQSHLYQHLKSTGDRIYIDSFSRKWTYANTTSILTMYNATFPNFNGDADFRVQVNNKTITASACLGNSVIFNLFDPVTLRPYYNQASPSTTGSGTYGGFFGSYIGNCSKQGNQYNFEFSYKDTTGRRRMRDFMDWIPNGVLVTVRLIHDAPYQQTAALWKSDQGIYGVGNTFYDRLKQAGFIQLDSFSYPRTWVFNYEKNNSLYVPEWQFSKSLSDLIQYTRYIISSDTLGFITSPTFGPAKAWKNVLWNGYSLDAKSGDKPTVDVVGVDTFNNETVLYSLNTLQQNFNISNISVLKYPYIKLRMRNADSVNLTAYQLRWWRILYDPVPEGALAPNILYNFRDSVSLGQTDSLAIAFKNVSEVPFADSITVNLTVYDANNAASNIIIKKLKALTPGDTAVIKAVIPTTSLSGLNNLYLDVNPTNVQHQPEQTHFNNFMYRNFAVAVDSYKPVLDVTFDGVHILNNDIVAAKPHVLIKMKDESDFLLLNDTSLMNVQLRYPDGTLRPFYFNTDTLIFTAATSGANNTASIDFTPYLTDDGVYQLIVHGKDKTGNTAGLVDYTVSFEVYNKPMITNMFNYPNPFTSSTAFVFTVTGSEVPQNIRIQILTITGKIVKEITKEELGPLHIGRNITDYKWNGTDQYGDQLANGVYIYRVLTNLNGKSLDKFPTYGQDGYEVNTNKYFTKGYGKMYLMR